VSYANTPTYPNFKDITPCGIFPEANVIFLTRFADGEPGHPGPETLDFGRQIDGSWVGAKSYDCSPSFLLKVTCFVDYELHPQAQVASSLK
jgi:hypothetical protein